MLLLSASDVRSPAAGWARIERLYHLDGGRHVGIVFLLHETGPKDDGIDAYMELQARWVQYETVTPTAKLCSDFIIRLIASSFEMPILPLLSVDSLETTLFSYQRQLLQSRIPRMVASPASTILPTARNILRWQNIRRTCSATSSTASAISRRRRRPWTARMKYADG